jgi:cytochrome o ubiquinol oxidase subunit 2
MKKRKNKLKAGRYLPLILLGIVCLGLLITLLLHGTNVALFNPKGFIAEQQFRLILFTVTLLLAIGIPTLILLYFFAWEFRESNQNASYDPNKRQGIFFAFGLWVIPSIFVLLLASVALPASHKLDQHRQIADTAKPLTIQVIALRWKWLFIYPDKNISTVNFVQIPTGVPIQFELTADETPMSSFWIPQLGGQLYAMTGHQNQLNLLADTPGDYTGRSAEINGAGFADMKFTARASSVQDFDEWVQGVQTSTNELNSVAYNKLLLPSEKNEAAFYYTTETDLYDKVLMKYMGTHNHNLEMKLKNY